MRQIALLLAICLTIRSGFCENAKGTSTVADSTQGHIEFKQERRNGILAKSDYSFVRCDSQFADRIVQIIAVVDSIYLRIARDLQFDPTLKRFGVAVVSSQTYREITPDGSGGYFPGRREKYAEFIYIDGSLWPPGTANFGQVVIHELTHWVCYQLRGGKRAEKLGHLRHHLISARAFEEALAQYEDGRSTDVAARLRGQFHDSHYLTIAQMDSSVDPATELGATTEFHVLIPLLVSHNGLKLLQAVLRKLKTLTLSAALASELGDDYATIEKQWFDTMVRLAASP